MKRDLDLIRYLLLEQEDEKAPKELENYSQKQIEYHYALAVDAGLLVGDVMWDSGDDVLEVRIERISWAGHDFLDVARNETLWAKAKKKIADAGGAWTFDVLKDLLVGLLRSSLQ